MRFSKVVLPVAFSVLASLSCGGGTANPLSLPPSAATTPSITSLTVTPASIAAGGQASLAVVATDSDGDQNLSARWAANFGRFTPATGMKTVYTNTEPAQEDVITVVVTNSSGLEAQGSAVVTFTAAASSKPSPSPSVAPSPLPAPSPSPEPNPRPKPSPEPSPSPSPKDVPPVVSVQASSQSCHPLPSAPCQVPVQATASSPMGDPLTYQWSGCASGSSAVASCSVTALQSFTASVTVSDAHGGQTTASLSVTGVNHAPLASGGSGSWSVSCPLSDGPAGQAAAVSLGFSDADHDSLQCKVSCNSYCKVTSVDWCVNGSMRAEVLTTGTSGLMAVTLVVTDPWGASGTTVTECGY